MGWKGEVASPLLFVPASKCRTCNSEFPLGALGDNLCANSFSHFGWQYHDILFCNTGPSEEKFPSGGNDQAQEDQQPDTEGQKPGQPVDSQQPDCEDKKPDQPVDSQQPDSEDQKPDQQSDSQQPDQPVCDADQEQQEEANTAAGDVKSKVSKKVTNRHIK